ncbi:MULTISPECIES: APC family permease [Pseudonocardia]|uniref:Putrescine importer PuuP n=2 Tax=Pseudonocardia TaxID=1847 RepID=A0A1Y2MT65_PSEAH|nr:MULTISPECIES: APC family permease [Pseudonocardia]OSY38393.1 Putrescine importer PuuP [Pseudonocardia autotrophica]TDN72563.1 amino acid/polyamine/organocation transporter (APC superfamily) [Pseudonocardia autotrophica]BBG03271.1 amino acid permease [Pseudonocardia autotrophica]GEC24529.1 amino acid permease [Pseudonocardia saturnea]
MARHATVDRQVPGLRRRRLGVVHLVFFTVAASAPLTVLAGGVTTAYAVSGNQGVPLAFLGVAAVLVLFAVGYAAMSRHVANAGAFYAYLSRGIGRPAGVAGSFVALVAYNAIQIALYGLFGVAMSDFVAELAGLRLPWWSWAVFAMLAVGWLGLLRVDLNARVLAVLLLVEVAVVVAFDVVGFTEPADGVVSTDPLLPSTLLAGGIGAVIAFTVASFTGFESGAIYSEEARDPRRTVARATFVAVAFTGLFYALSAWAMVAATGAADLQARAADEGPGLVFGPLADRFGPLVADIAVLLLLTSVFAALLSFHNGVARYLFALGRERVLPAGLATVGARSGGPIAGSLTQSLLAAVVVFAFAVTGADPMLALFSWFSGLSAVGVVLLMTGTSISVIGFFRRNRTAKASLWARTIAPALAALLLAAILTVLVGNFDALLGADPSSPARWVLPGIVLLAAVIGVGWALYLRRTRPEVYEGIGAGAPAPDGVAPDTGAPAVYLRRAGETGPADWADTGSANEGVPADDRATTVFPIPGADDGPPRSGPRD